MNKDDGCKAPCLHCGALSTWIDPVEVSRDQLSLESTFEAVTIELYTVCQECGKESTLLFDVPHAGYIPDWCEIAHLEPSDTFIAFSDEDVSSLEQYVFSEARNAAEAALRG